MEIFMINIKLCISYLISIIIDKIIMNIINSYSITKYIFNHKLDEEKFRISYKLYF